MLTEYYFKIKYIKGINNIKVDALNKRIKLQGDKRYKELF